MKRLMISLRLGLLAFSGCSAISGIQHGDVNQLVQTGQSVAGLTQDLGKCDSLGQTEVSFEEERTIGGAVALNWVQQGGGLLVDVPSADERSLADPRRLSVGDTSRNRLAKYLNVVGKNLAARSSRPTLQWTFGVLDASTVNAISAPGGYVFVTRGLLQRVDSEAALAGVLSHEIAHVTHKDSFLIYQQTKVDRCKTLAYAKAGQREGMASLQAYSPQFLQTAIGAFNSISGGPLDLNAAANNALLTLFSDEFVHRYLEGGYARDQELAADATGLELATASGYNPRGFTDFIGGLPAGGGFFAHHPPPAERLAAMKVLLASRKQAPFSPFAQDVALLPLIPLKDELAAAR
jgi:hypothetical protein